VVRCIKFLEPMSAGILSSHRSIPPFGLNGGKPGKLGVNKVIRNNGEVEMLTACAGVEVQTGDAIQIETLGGGGFGCVEA